MDIAGFKTVMLSVSVCPYYRCFSNVCPMQNVVFDVCKSGYGSFLTKIQMVQWRLDESLRESKQLHKHFAVQVDEIERLQSMLHGQELLAQKQAQLHSADITDREEEISRLKSDVKILQEGISSNDAVVSVCY